VSRLLSDKRKPDATTTCLLTADCRARPRTRGFRLRPDGYLFAVSVNRPSGRAIPGQPHLRRIPEFDGKRTNQRSGR
jgi:hypothetical protein